jgi:hypothetical protein
LMSEVMQIGTATRGPRRPSRRSGGLAADLPTAVVTWTSDAPARIGQSAVNAVVCDLGAHLTRGSGAVRICLTRFSRNLR